MQYKTITAAFALFASAAMAIPATGPADAAALQARGDGLVGGLLNDVGHIVVDVLSDLGLYDDVTSWQTYTNDNGEPCHPYTVEYNYAFAYKSKFCYTVTSNDGCDDCTLGGQKFPKCRKWHAYKDHTGKTCQPYTAEYEYQKAYDNDCYDSY